MKRDTWQRIIILYTCIPSMIIFAWRQYQNFPQNWAIEAIMLGILTPLAMFPIRWCIIEIMDEDNAKKIWIFRIIILTIFYWYIVKVWIENNQNRTCYDKTSIDYNRQNDMKCINKIWEIKRTDYEWARILMWK